MPSSQAAKIIRSAAIPRSNIKDSGASVRDGSGVTSAIPTAAPARCPAYRPTSASCRRCSRSRQTMNAQRCWFFELFARRPAWRIRPGAPRRGVDRRTAGRPGATTLPPRPTAAARSAEPGLVGGREGLDVDPLRRAGQGDLDEQTGSRPAPYRPRTGAPRQPALGRRPSPPRSAASSGASGPPRAAEASDGRAIGRILVQQECCPPGITSVSTGASFARPWRSAEPPRPVVPGARRGPRRRRRHGRGGSGRRSGRSRRSH